MHHIDRFAKASIGRVGIGHAILIGLVLLVDILLALLELSLDVLDAGVDLNVASRAHLQLDHSRWDVVGKDARSHRQRVERRRGVDGQIRGRVLAVLVTLHRRLLQLGISIGRRRGVNTIAARVDRAAGDGVEA